MLEGLTLSALAAAALLVAAGAVFVWAAASDLGAYRIPNLCVILILLLFPGFSLLAGGAAPLLPHVAVGGAVLLLGIPLYAAGFAGAGDFKLLAAGALWAGPAGLPAMLMVMALVGGLLGGVYWLRDKCRLRTAGATPQADDDVAAGDAEQATHLPYGVAISAGALLVLTQQLQALVA